MSATLFLTRKQHDKLLEAAPKLLRKAFAECKKGRGFGNGAYAWSADGVTFKALTEETADFIKRIL